MPPVQDDLRDRPIRELLKQLSQETSTLVKQELDLAKAEMTQKGKDAGVGAGFTVPARCSPWAPSAPSPPA